jgi:hypothetical protein
VSNKETIIKNTIFTNGDDITLVRNDLDQGLWEWGIDNALKITLDVGFASGQPVLQMNARNPSQPMNVRITAVWHDIRKSQKHLFGKLAHRDGVGGRLSRSAPIREGGLSWAG